MSNSNSTLSSETSQESGEQTGLKEGAGSPFAETTENAEDESTTESNSTQLGSAVEADASGEEQSTDSQASQPAGSSQSGQSNSESSESSPTRRVKPYIDRRSNVRDGRNDVLLSFVGDVQAAENPVFNAMESRFPNERISRIDLREAIFRTGLPNLDESPQTQTPTEERINKLDEIEYHLRTLGYGYYDGEQPLPTESLL